LAQRGNVAEHAAKLCRFEVAPILQLIDLQTSMFLDPGQIDEREGRQLLDFARTQVPVGVDTWRAQSNIAVGNRKIEKFSREDHIDRIAQPSFIMFFRIELYRAAALHSVSPLDRVLRSVGLLATQQYKGS
jgi:hypothetical protein